MIRGFVAILCVSLVLTLTACSSPREQAVMPPAGITAALPSASTKAIRLAQAAESQVGRTVRYDASYVAIDYPGGDVPIDRGVCTDVVVRALRELGVDLQVAVHEDMSAHFSEYPQNWGLAGPNANIDHRRVPNLQTYFTRTGKSVKVTDAPSDYRPGDVVTWSVDGRPHTGIVSTRPVPSGRYYCIVHNIGAGTQIEDALFRFEITGHYRLF